MSTQHIAIKAFVQQTLGCGCPEEVFQSVQCNRLNSLAWVKGRRVNIGNRLLVYLVSTQGALPTPTELAELLEAGRNDRDSHGFNRFRLALFSDDVQRGLPEPQSLIRKLYPSDEKIHLHILDRQQHPLP